MDPSDRILIRSLQVTKALKHDDINKFSLLVSDKCLFEISSSYNVLKLRYRAPYSDYKIVSYEHQNHSSVTLFTSYVYECLMNIFYTKFLSSYSVPKLMGYKGKDTLVSITKIHS